MRFCRAWRVRSKDARSRSIRLTTRKTGSPYSSAFFHIFSVWTSMPPTAETIRARVSATRSPWTASVVKMLYPGVSIRLTLTSLCSKKATAVLMVIPRSISSSSKSVTVCPSSTLANRLTAPLSKSSAETRVVLPVSEWPATATFRMASVV